jgi:predicted dehydrogenase
VTPAVRVGVIGTGFGAQVVAPAYAAGEDCEVVAVVSPRDTAAVADLCARRDVDLISVHSPPFLHVEHVRRAIEGGHAVLCDKPFGRDATESAEMVKLADDAGVLGLLNFERRFDPTRQRLRDLIRAGAIGDPVQFQYSRYIALPEPRPYNWLSDASSGGGWLGGQASHLIDAIRWLFGEIVVAAAVMRTLVPVRVDAAGVRHRCDAEDAVTAIFRSAGGVTASVDVAIESSVHLPEHTVVIGSAGMLEIDGAGVVLSTVDGPVRRYDVDLAAGANLTTSMRTWAALACAAVRGAPLHPDAPTFADGLACASVMDRIRSAG